MSHSRSRRSILKSVMVLVVVIMLVLLIVVGMGENQWRESSIIVSPPINNSNQLDVSATTADSIVEMSSVPQRPHAGHSVTTVCVSAQRGQSTISHDCEAALAAAQQRGLSHQINTSVQLPDNAASSSLSSRGPSRQQLLRETVCTPFRDLPPGPDGLGLFNIALSPIQIPISDVWTSRDAFPILASNVGGRPGNVVPNYQIVPPVGAYGFSVKDVIASPLSPPSSSAKKTPQPPYSSSSAKATTTTTTTTTTTVEVFGAIGRWCNYRSSFGLRGSMMLSVNYLGYVSVVATTTTIESPSATTSQSSTANRMMRMKGSKTHHDVRWHEMGMVPFPSNTTMEALSSFQRHNFPPVTGKKALGRGGLEDCLYFVTTRDDGSNRHFITANIGFNFGAGQMFIGEVTSRMLNTHQHKVTPKSHQTSPSPLDDNTANNNGNNSSSSSSGVLFDYEVVPFVEDPEGFGLRVGDISYNANRTFEKNWNVIPCDWDAIALQQQQQPHSSQSPVSSTESSYDIETGGLQQLRRRHQHHDGDIVCFLTNLAPKVMVYAFNMNTKKVVARWRHDNPKSTSKIYRGGKGVVAINHVIGGNEYHGRHTSVDDVTKRVPNSKNEVGGGGGLLTLVHEKLRGGYRLEWLLLNSSAPHNLIRPYLQKAHPNPTSLSNSHSPSSSVMHGGAVGRDREGHFKLAKVPVEYVRSITASQDKSHIYFGHSTHDARGQFCVVPLPTAASAAVHGLS